MKGGAGSEETISDWHQDRLSLAGLAETAALVKVPPDPQSGEGGVDLEAR